MGEGDRLYEGCWHRGPVPVSSESNLHTRVDCPQDVDGNFHAVFHHMLTHACSPS